jgi:hypothetical protein
MRNFNAFLMVPTRDKKLLIGAALLVAVIRLGFWLLPFRMMNKGVLFSRDHLYRSPRGTACTPERVAWAIKIASKYVPVATCLIQAVAAHVLLALQGHRSRIWIGIAKSGSTLESHAWVECQGKTVIGESLDYFTPLLCIDCGR